MAEENMVIEVEPIASPEPAVEQKPDAGKTAEAAKPAATTQPDPVAELRQQLETLNAAKATAAAEAERAKADAQAARGEAAKAAEEARQARGAVVDSNISAVDSAIAAAQAEADGAARDQEAAMTAGNFKAAAEYGRKMARAEARIERLQEGKADLAERKASQPQQAEAKPPADQFEAVIAGSTPRAQQWLRAHPTYVTDPGLNRKATIAHLEAVDKGLTPDSDAYFEFCEEKLGLRTAAAAQAQPAAERQRTRAMPSAPVTRDASPTGGALSPTQVTLSPGEQRAAQDGSVVWNYSDPKIGAVKGAPVGIKEYARRKASMTQEGRYDRSFTEN